MSRDHRYGLANARRKYLHYNAQMTGVPADAERVARDLDTIVRDFGSACDHIDDLTLRIEKLQEENRRLLDAATTPTPYAEASS